VNDAFGALDAFTLEQLLADGNEALLEKVLTLHAISGEITSDQPSDGQTATTLEGTDVTFDLSDAADPKINGTSIVATDIQVVNGVIHLVDEVLIPTP